MSADPNKKSSHQFQCRDVLWETFEQMARELECSVDYLINEAMKQYAKQRSYGGQRTPYPAPGRGAEGQQAPQSDQRSYPGVSASSPPTSPPQMSARPMPPPPGQSRAPGPGGGRPGGAPLPVPPPRGGMPVPPPPGMPGRAGPMGMPPVARSVPPPPPGRSVPPPLPRAGTPLPSMGGAGANGYPAPAGHAATLTLIYQGERFPVTKDRFVIGRGKQSSDLTLKDPNVSRQHAMVEFQNGVYFMVDMGSTNGVEYNGQRIARKQIAEGDVYKICDHDLVFTYR